jgi:hypothetical protein
MALLSKRILLLSLFTGLTVAISPLTSYSQNDACKTINQGTPQAACEHPGAGCDAGNGPGTGRCVYQTGDLRCDCAATHPLPAYTLNVAPLTPGTVRPGGSSNSGITFTPVGGYSGNITLNCGFGGRFMACSVNPKTVSSSGTSTLTVNATDGTNNTLPGKYGIAVTASDQNGVAPSNGTQTVTLTVSNGGGAIAFGTFAGLLTLWIWVGTYTRRRAFAV